MDSEGSYDTYDWSKGHLIIFSCTRINYIFNIIKL